jgi:hypothetical protein
MYDSAKYLIHADIEASGVVERSDVVGAVFGQTEGLLGDELDLRDLQESQKLGRIDVGIDSEGGHTFGEITIASGLDRVETAILAAALESIERVGPCRADVEVTELEDVRSAKRREIVERATQLLAEFDETALTSQDIVEEVREAIRVEDITEFHGLPAGPRVGDSDAIIVVEGRADVLTLLQYGVKNAIAVEGTDVPDAVATLTNDRTVTAFLDGDRGGDLILKELTQVGDIDYVALAPPGRSVEDLSRGEVTAALREKVPFEAVDDADAEALAATDGSTRPAPSTGSGTDPDGDRGGDESESGSGDESGDGNGNGTPDPTGNALPDGTRPTTDSPATTQSPSTSQNTVGAGGADAEGERAGADSTSAPDEAGTAGETADDSAGGDRPAGDASAEGVAEDGRDGEPSEGSPSDGGVADPPDAGSTGESNATTEESEPATLAGHVAAVVHDGSGLVRGLDQSFETVAEGPADEAFEWLDGLAETPAAVVLDGELSQRLLDVAAQRGVEQVVPASEGEYVKQPTAVRVRTADQF